MERLTNKKLKTICDGYFVNFASKEEAVKYRLLAESAPKYEEIYKKLADYEDKEEQGLLLELPVPIGTTVYITEDDCGGDVCDCGGDCGNCASHRKYVDEIEFDYCLIHAWGKWVFATEAEAESALAKMGGK